MLNYVKIYYMSAILGGKSMNKWEERYNKLKNGEFDSRIDELKEKHNNKSITKEEYKEYQKLLKSKESLSKVDNVLEYKEQLKEELKKLELEKGSRDNAIEASKETQRLEEELKKITEEIIKTENELKKSNLEEHEKDELSAKRDELYARRDDNNAKYVQNQKVLEKSLNRKDEFKNLSEEEIKNKENLLKSRISKCNMVAKNLLNGASWDTINLKLDNWDKEKRYTNKKEESVLEENKNKLENSEKEDLFENIFSETEKNSKGLDEYDIISDSNAEAYNRNKQLMFEKKHPRLAKIQNWLKKVFGNKRKMLQEGKEIENKVVEDKVEDKVEEKVEDKTIDDISFREYIKVVAEKGMDGAETDRQQKAKERLAKFREEKGYRQGNTGGTMTPKGREALNKIDETVQEIDDGSR